ncbi:hypothetical protein WK23_21140 [Burkholderia vietnamiensis]|nr:hypothetical protein WK23_21140 [Burkholderia vietnamiensis]
MAMILFLKIVLQMALIRLLLALEWLQRVLVLNHLQTVHKAHNQSGKVFPVMILWKQEIMLLMIPIPVLVKSWNLVKLHTSMMMQTTKVILCH